MSSSQSNPHPYAIKTTSTGVLSRSNSARSSASAAHHFVPSSPTKPTSAPSRPTSHRYSSSLSSNELPRPLPVPPDRRAAGIDDDLPDDPRTWSPSDLSTYLSASLRLTSGDLPPLVAHDIAAFVRTRNITGKKFLRLTDGDLDEYGLNQLWQDALLRASRVLRQDSLRGRVWNTSFFSGEDDACSSASSSSSLNGRSLADIADARRGRRESESSGRVKGMVASFERSSSPTKSSSSTSLNMSPTKPRSRPQSDILSSRHPPSDYPTPKESRLLPYPPSGYGLYAPAAAGPPPLLPQDTSASEYTPFPSGVLPFSPQSTGPIPISSPDYHSSVEGLTFPQSFADPYHTDTHGASRPLPFPPHPAPQYYHRPTTSVGENGVVGVPGMRMPRGVMGLEDEPEHAVVDDRGLTDPFSTPPLSMAQHQQQQQQQPSSSSLLGFSHPEILSPQPRLGSSGRDSPTKVLEEKLEELLEPRPRSRIVSTHSRVVSDGRPRSRVASINININVNGSGSLRSKKEKGSGSRVGTPGNGSLRSVGGDGGEGERDDDGEEGTQQQQQPRTRVVSISSRNHAHRLSGVEVWGESHPHYHHHHHHHNKKRQAIPFVADEEEEMVSVDDHVVTGGEVKEEESACSSEDGEIGNIDAVLEKGESLMGGHGKESSGGDASSTVGLTTKEPKSSVITVVERGPSRNVNEEEEEEESVEALLEKEEGRGRVGGEAWESVGEVETVKRVVGEEKEKEGRNGIEDVFLEKNEGNCDVIDDSKLSSPTVDSRRSSGGAWVTTGLNETKKMKLKKRSRKSDDVKGSLVSTAMMTETKSNDDEEEEEVEVLRGKVREMREMVEDVRGRLGSVEKWMEGYEKRVAQRKKQEKVQSGTNGGLVTKLVKGFSTLLLGYHSSSSPSLSTSRPHQPLTLTLARRMKKWGVNVSSCVVLLGIGMCMVVLRMLGRRPGGGAVGVGMGVGRMVGHGVLLSEVNGGRR